MAGNIVARLAALEAERRRPSGYEINLSWGDGERNTPAHACTVAAHGPSCVIEDGTERHVVQLTWSP
jgi:hypothetical protein